METPTTKALMQGYLKKTGLDKKQPKFWNYMEARLARMHNNHYALLEFAKELTKHGFECYITRSDAEENRLIKSIRIIKDGKEAMCGFSEVPYHWYIGSSVINSPDGLQSGLIGEHGYDFPFDIEDVEQKLIPCRHIFDSTYPIKIE